MLPKATVAEIDLGQVPFTPVFKWLQDVGSVAEREMLRTFNCGIGMIVVVAAKDAKKVAASLKRSGETVVTLGTHPQAQGHGRTGRALRLACGEMRKARTAILISGRGSNMMALVEAARDAGLSGGDRLRRLEPGGCQGARLCRRQWHSHHGDRPQGLCHAARPSRRHSTPISAP